MLFHDPELHLYYSGSPNHTTLQSVGVSDYIDIVVVILSDLRDIGAVTTEHLEMRTPVASQLCKNKETQF